MATIFGPKRSFTGNLYVGGQFTDYDNSGYQYFTKLNSTNASLFSGSPYNNNSFDGNIYSITKYTSRRILIGGSFSTYNGENSSLLVSIDFDGNIDNTFRVYDNIIHNSIFAIGVDSYDRVIIGGDIDGYGGTYTVGYIMRLNLDGSYDTSFITGTGFDKPVLAIAVQKDNKILIGGDIGDYDGNTIKYIVRLNEDGSLDNSFSCALNAPVFSIVIDSDDTIIVGGQFTDVGGDTVGRIVRLNPDGRINDDFGTGANGDIYGLKLDSKRRILACGSFNAFQGANVSNLARILPNNILDVDFFTKNAFDNKIFSVDVDSGDNVFVGGLFLTCNSVSTPGLVKLKESNADIEPGFNVGLGYTANTRVNAVLFSNQ